VDWLQVVLKRLHHSTLVIVHPKKFSPFSLPLFIERMSGHLTTESLAERIEKIKNSWVKP
jgi:ATP-dependent Lhr-like helicase